MTIISLRGKKCFFFWWLATAGFALVSSDAANLQAPRMVLNRSLFLEWDQVPSNLFQSYEVFFSLQSGFTPIPANRVKIITDFDLNYTRIYGLSPSTTYYIRIRRNTTIGSDTSAEVSATTLPDGVNETRVPTLMYHNVQPRNQFPSGFDPGGWMSTENLTRDLSYLKAHGVNAVGFQEILDRANNGTPLPPNPVFLTFDDGFVNYLNSAVPILLTYDYHSVNAIVTRKTGGSSDWAVPEWPLMPLMTWNQIKECQRKGMWMGSHTQTHVDLNLEPNKAGEIVSSRNDLIAQLKTHPRYFCYPWGMGGKQNQTIINQVGSAGFTLATRTWPPAVATVGSDKLWFPRVFVNQNDTLRDFLVKLDLDTDKDGIKNHIEMDWGLNGASADTDGDGLSDYFEVNYDGNPNAYNPYHPTSNPNGTDLDAKRTDTDLDGISDYNEIHVYGTNPLRNDTDGDGISDYNEIFVYGTNPRSADTDLDGMTDFYELNNGFNPLVPSGRHPYIGGPHPVSSCIEVENFDFGGPNVAYVDGTATNLGNTYRRHEYVDLASDASASNGVVMGWTTAGEWTSYSINASSGGFYKVAFRVAASGNGGAFSLLLDGTNVTGTLSVPNTGGWSAWTVVTSPTFYIPGGTHVVRLVMNTAGSSGFVGSFDRFCFQYQPPPVPQGPFPLNSAPRNMPGFVEAEDFDVGGPDIAYFDTTLANEGGQYRASDGVGISADPAASNGFVVGWTKASEWMEYTLNIVSSGTYVVETRVAAVGNNGSFRIEFNGSDKTGTLAVPNTGAWNVYQLVTRTNVSLVSGIQTMRVVMVANGTSGFVGAFDRFQILTGTLVAPPPPPPPAGQSAYPAGVPWAMPGTVEIENFDLGGQGVAYFDTTPANEGGQYRTTEAVDISNDAGAGNGRVVGWTKADEWMEYTVAVPTAGMFAIETRVAGVGLGGQFRIDVDGGDKTGNIAVPNTGAWNSFATVTRSNVSLASGIQTVRVVMVANGVSGFVAAFDWFRITSSAPPEPFLTAYPAGVPWAIPGVLETENFDRGGQGLGYHDTTPANLGGQYRTSEAVDIAADPAASNGFVVGWTTAGEWLAYTFRVTNIFENGYLWQTRVAGAGTGGQFRVEVNGVDVSGNLDVPNTGAWNVYQEVGFTIDGTIFTEGVSTARLVMVRQGVSGFVGAFDRMVISEIVPTPLSRKKPRVSSPPQVIDIRSRDEVLQPGDAWAAVDGDPSTVWHGVPNAGGWWLAMVVEPALALQSLHIEWVDGSPTNFDLLVSQNADDWQSVVFPITNRLSPYSYYWLMLPDQGDGSTPAIHDIFLNGPTE